MLETKLSDLVGERSYMFFDSLGFSCSWLQLPPAEWADCADFTKARDFAVTVKTTNDVC